MTKKNEDDFPPPPNKHNVRRKYTQDARGIGDTISKLINTLTRGKVEKL